MRLVRKKTPVEVANTNQSTRLQGHQIQASGRIRPPPWKTVWPFVKPSTLNPNERHLPLRTSPDYTCIGAHQDMWTRSHVCRQ